MNSNIQRRLLQPFLRSGEWFTIAKISVVLDLCVTRMFYTKGGSYSQVVLAQSQVTR